MWRYIKKELHLVDIHWQYAPDKTWKKELEWILHCIWIRLKWGAFYETGCNLAIFVGDGLSRH